MDDISTLNDWGFTGTLCNHCGIKNSEISGLLMQCARCKQAYYCSSKCFNEALPEHQKFCQSGIVERNPTGSLFQADEVEGRVTKLCKTTKSDRNSSKPVKQPNKEKAKNKGKNKKQKESEEKIAEKLKKSLCTELGSDSEEAGETIADKSEIYMEDRRDSISSRSSVSKLKLSKDTKKVKSDIKGKSNKTTKKSFGKISDNVPIKDSDEIYNKKGKRILNTDIDSDGNELEDDTIEEYETDVTIQEIRQVVKRATRINSVEKVDKSKKMIEGDQYRKNGKSSLVTSDNDNTDSSDLLSESDDDEIYKKKGKKLLTSDVDSDELTDRSETMTEDDEYHKKGKRFLVGKVDCSDDISKSDVDLKPSREKSRSSLKKKKTKKKRSTVKNASIHIGKSNSSDVDDITETVSEFAENEKDTNKEKKKFVSDIGSDDENNINVNMADQNSGFGLTRRETIGSKGRNNISSTECALHLSQNKAATSENGVSRRRSSQSGKHDINKDKNNQEVLENESERDDLLGKKYQIDQLKKKVDSVKTNERNQVSNIPTVDVVLGQSESDNLPKRLSLPGRRSEKKVEDDIFDEYETDVTIQETRQVVVRSKADKSKKMIEGDGYRNKGKSSLVGNVDYDSDSSEQERQVKVDTKVLSESDDDELCKKKDKKMLTSDIDGDELTDRSEKITEDDEYHKKDKRLLVGNVDYSDDLSKSDADLEPSRETSKSSLKKKKNKMKRSTSQNSSKSTSLDVDDITQTVSELEESEKDSKKDKKHFVSDIGSEDENINNETMVNQNSGFGLTRRATIGSKGRNDISSKESALHVSQNKDTTSENGFNRRRWSHSGKQEIKKRTDKNDQEVLVNESERDDLLGKKCQIDPLLSIQPKKKVDSVKTNERNQVFNVSSVGEGGQSESDNFPKRLSLPGRRSENKVEDDTFDEYEMDVTIQESRQVLLRRSTVNSVEKVEKSKNMIEGDVYIQKAKSSLARNVDYNSDFSDQERQLKVERNDCYEMGSDSDMGFSISERGITVQSIDWKQSGWVNRRSNYEMKSPNHIRNTSDMRCSVSERDATARNRRGSLEKKLEGADILGNSVKGHKDFDDDRDLRFIKKPEWVTQRSSQTMSSREGNHRQNLVDNSDRRMSASERIVKNYTWAKPEWVDRQLRRSSVSPAISSTEERPLSHPEWVIKSMRRASLSSSVQIDETDRLRPQHASCMSGSNAYMGDRTDETSQSPDTDDSQSYDKDTIYSVSERSVKEFMPEWVSRPLRRSSLCSTITGTDERIQPEWVRYPLRRASLSSIQIDETDRLRPQHVSRILGTNDYLGDCTDETSRSPNTDDSQSHEDATDTMYSVSERSVKELMPEWVSRPLRRSSLCSTITGTDERIQPEWVRNPLRRASLSTSMDSEETDSHRLKQFCHDQSSLDFRRNSDTGVNFGNLEIVGDNECRRFSFQEKSEKPEWVKKRLLRTTSKGLRIQRGGDIFNNSAGNTIQSSNAR